MVASGGDRYPEESTGGPATDDLAHLASAIAAIPAVQRAELPAAIGEALSGFVPDAVVVVAEFVPGDGFAVRRLAGPPRLLQGIEQILGHDPLELLIPASGRAPAHAGAGPTVTLRRLGAEEREVGPIPAETLQDLEVAIGPRDVLAHDLVIQRRIVAHVALLLLEPLTDEQRRILEAMLQTAAVAYHRHEELHEVREQLRGLGVVAGGVAHDINNLLMAIQASVQLTRMDVPDDLAEAGLLDEALATVGYAAELCRRLQHCSDLQQTQMRMIDLNDLIRETLPMISVKVPEGVALLDELEPDLPRLLADATQLRQVVLNVVTNAIEAVGDGGGVVRITTRSGDYDHSSLFDTFTGQELREGTYVLLEVEDDGCGMHEETVDRMFEPFFSRKDRGRGLGLASVMGIVRAHGGTPQVESEPGLGTRLQILFPIPLPTARADVVSASDI